MAVMSHRDLFRTDAKIDELTDQPTRHRVRIGARVDRAAATDAEALDNVVGVEPVVRQSIQMSQVVQKLLSPIVVGSFDQLLDEGDVGISSFKVATAAQQQCLIDAILEMPVRRFDVAVFVGTASVRTLGFAVVITHEGRISLGQFATTRVISYRRSQRITAMPLRHSTKFPERFLNACAQRFKGFGKAQRHAFDVAVRQDAVEQRVIKSLSGDLHTQLIAHREVTGGQSSRVMLLIKENRLSGAMQTAPLAHASLKSATCRIRKLSCVTLLQPLKQCLRFEPRFDFETPLHCVPNVSKRIAACSIGAIGSPL